MSKAIKKVGKTFKKVAKAVWKVAKPVAIAVAAYFTAGVALSFIPATAGFAASLPGFAGGGIAGTGVGAGATAGTGIFSTVASKIGLGSRLAAGAGEGSALMAGLTGVSPQLQSGIVGGEIGRAGVMTTAYKTAGLGSTMAPAGATKAGMSLADKILLAKVGTDVVGAAFGPTEEDLMKLEAQYAQEARKGNYYGMDPQGNVAPGGMPDWQLFQPEQPTRQEMVSANNQPLTVQQPTTATPQQPQSQPGPADAGADQTRIQAGRNRAQQLFQTPMSERVPFEEEGDTGMPGLFGKGQMKQQYDVPEGIFAPAAGVRYV